jgi:N-acetylglucosamine kinase-like BadF-type ATPase
VAFYLGIDGGGSKTACVVGDQIKILGRGETSGSNIVRVGEEAARKALHTAIRQACAEANIQPSQISRTAIGVAGAGRPEISNAIHRLAAEILGGEIEVVGDMEIALHAAFGAGPGVIVIAGTGSIAFGRNAAGETARAGGWGFAVSDEGSGGWIGRRALAAALRTRDEGGDTPLLEGARTCWSLNSLDHLIISANATPPPDFAGLFPAIVSVADSGDEIAQTVLTDAGGELANLAEIVISRLFAEAAVSVAMTGGVFRNGGLVRESFRNSLALNHSVSVNPDVVDPVEGALAMARTEHER